MEHNAEIYAIVADGIGKSYGKLPVLNNLNLEVKEGHIYGLLGPSGCGKTTLLKCVIGFLGIDKGVVKVFDKQPGTVGSDVPGKLVGYMPQELALYHEFTIEQTLQFFGRVQGMSGKEINERIKFMVNFLDLPSAKRRIDKLSGGQQRRVSLAVALLHNPRILILDEPTVGVDPVLRQRIWDHLLDIAKTSNTTIIITTHYIEEARQADRVGLMRQGRILAEGTPDSLLERHQMNSLENVFLHLCLRDDNPLNEYDDDVALLGLRDEDSDFIHSEEHLSAPVNHSNGWDNSYEAPTNKCVLCCRKTWSYFPKPRNVFALLIKDMTLMLKKILFLLFQFLLPAIQMTLFSLCIGGTPANLPIAIINHDVGISTPFNLSLASTFVSSLDNMTVNSGVKLFDIKADYQNISDARKDIHEARRWAALYFNASFTEDMLDRFTESPDHLSPSVLNGSTIKVWMDFTDQQVALTITEKITTALENLPGLLLPPGMIPSGISSLPIEFEAPVYGSRDPSFLVYMAPGIILSMIFFMSSGLTALSFVLEKKEGLLERTLVSGVNMMEIMIGHVLTQFVNLIIQVTVLLICTFLIFKIQNEGSLVLIVILTLFQGFTGMALGLVISAVSRDEMTATQLVLATVYPLLLISGIIWPIEAMPYWMQKISEVMPMTMSAKAFRCIMTRGWDLYQYQVWTGFLVVLGWGWGFCIIAAIIISVKGAT